VTTLVCYGNCHHHQSNRLRAPPKLDHLFRMTDNTGIFQHAIFNVPSFAEGYCTDHNARAFILTVLLEETTNKVTEQQFERLASVYLAFLWHAFNQETCRFRNFMNHQRQWMDREGSEDSHGRALWATGTALGRSKNKEQRTSQPVGTVISAGTPSCREFHFAESVGFGAARNSGISARLFRGSDRKTPARGTYQSFSGSLPDQLFSGLDMPIA
jgi:hypothetical protein